MIRFHVQERKYFWSKWKNVCIPWGIHIKDISDESIKVYAVHNLLRQVFRIAQMYKDSLRLDHGRLIRLDNKYFFFTYRECFIFIENALEHERQCYVPEFSEVI